MLSQAVRLHPLVQDRQSARREIVHDARAHLRFRSAEARPSRRHDSISPRMELETLRDLYIHELKDLYSAEQQLTKALPKMAKAASNRQLSSAFTRHNEQTKRQAKRLEDILKSMRE